MTEPSAPEKKRFPHYVLKGVSVIVNRAMRQSGISQGPRPIAGHFATLAAQHAPISRSPSLSNIITSAAAAPLPGDGLLPAHSLNRLRQGRGGPAAVSAGYGVNKHDWESQNGHPDRANWQHSPTSPID
jgi:hypothetical protein